MRRNYFNDFINYKIFLSCKDNHETDNIFLKDFEKTQKNDKSKIICKKCKEKNRSTSYNYYFFNYLNRKKIYVFYANQIKIKTIT